MMRGPDLISQDAEWHDAAVESACGALVRRYGVVFRDLMERETAMPRWRELLGMFRRMEARGTVRGGRFVSGFGGEQFALPEALEGLRAMRGREEIADTVTYSAADPMNLVGVVIPGEREAAITGRSVTYPATVESREQKTNEPAPISMRGLPFNAATNDVALA
jgi:ATP-dependent Lhr-like helicase